MTVSDDAVLYNGTMGHNNEDTSYENLGAMDGANFQPSTGRASLAEAQRSFLGCEEVVEEIDEHPGIHEVEPLEDGAPVAAFLGTTRVVAVSISC